LFALKAGLFFSCLAFFFLLLGLQSSGFFPGRAFSLFSRQLFLTRLFPRIFFGFALCLAL
jgi:hypothetical protein